MTPLPHIHTHKRGIHGDNCWKNGELFSALQKVCQNLGLYRSYKLYQKAN